MDASSEFPTTKNDVWSGIDVLKIQLKNRYVWSIFSDLNTIKRELWRPGIYGFLFYIRYFLMSFFINRYFNQLHILLLTINTFFISEDPISKDGSLNILNLFIYVYFLLEILLKFGAFGFLGEIY